MQIGILTTLPTLGLEDYDAVWAALGAPADWPAGLLVHAATQGDDGVHLTEAWESRAQADAFLTERLGPAMAKALGARAAAPQVTEVALHALAIAPVPPMAHLRDAAGAIHNALATANLDLSLTDVQPPEHYLGRLVATGLLTEDESAALAEIIEPFTGHRVVPDPERIPERSRALRVDPSASPAAVAIAGPRRSVRNASACARDLSLIHI